MMNCSASPPGAKPRVSRADAARELLRRRSSRSALLGFILFTFPGYQAEPAHALMASYIDRVVSGELKRLMIFAPPQHGKSEIFSRKLPPYWLAKHPDLPVILTSYAASLAESHSRDARSCVESPAYGRLFPGITTRQDSRDVSHWRISERRGELIAAGVGGPVTGHGGGLVIIDDPHANWQQAHSPTHRQNVIDWYRGTLRPRAWEGAPIILGMTRWHLEDLAGWLLSERRDQWEVLRLTAVAETQGERDKAADLMGLPLGQPDPLGRKPGDALCPGRFSREELDRIREDVGEFVWWAAYMNSPVRLMGKLVDRETYEIISELPSDLRWMRFWDPNFSDNTDSDETASIAGAYDSRENLILRDGIAGHWADCSKVILQTMAAEPAEWPIGIEAIASQSVVWRDVMGAAASRNRHVVPIRYEGLDAKDKVVRAMPWIIRGKARKVKLYDPQGTWALPWLTMLEQFPMKGRDRADAISGVNYMHSCVVRADYSIPAIIVGQRGRDPWA